MEKKKMEKLEKRPVFKKRREDTKVPKRQRMRDKKGEWK